MSTQGKPQALLIQLEFATWNMARPWTYSANFAIQEGLQANGYECLTIPAIFPSSSPGDANWLKHAERLCRGKQFDLVWVWLVHYEYDRQLLEWIASLAPVRVGFVMESLSYTQEEQRFSPITATRAMVTESQLAYMTHAVVVDEVDATAINAKGTTPAFWCPLFVPERFIDPPDEHPVHHVAAFHGTPYGHRQAWLDHPGLKGVLVSPTSSPSAVQRLFDQLQLRAAELLARHPDAIETLLPKYVSDLQRVRLAEFTQWMKSLREWACIVNLPGFQKGYGGRVYEAMAAGRPVISWDITNRPRNRALFEEGKDILFFPKDDPRTLAQHVASVLRDKGYAYELARNANRKMFRHHTAEKRIQQILSWIATGVIPSFSDGEQTTSHIEPTFATLLLNTAFDAASSNEPTVKTTLSTEARCPNASLLLATQPGSEGQDSETGRERSRIVPKVSIIIPCYQQAQFLAEAVTSVIVQSYRDWECIIVDDGSPDDTAAVADQLIATYPTHRIRLIRKTNGGLADARNAGIRAAQGVYLLPLDADDCLHPDYLNETVSILEQHADIAVVYVDEQNFGESSHVHRKDISTLARLIQANVHDYCSVYRRAVWEAVGGYSPAMYLGAEDWSFWLAAAKMGFRSHHLAKPLFLYRNRPGTMVAQVHANQELVRAHLVMHHPDVFSEDVQRSARTRLSQLSLEHAEKLARVCALHPANNTLQLFQQLARIQTTVSSSLRKEHEGVLMHSEKTDMDEQAREDAYYAELFIKNPEWSTPEPNNDETARWVKIAAYLEHIVRLRARKGETSRLRILDLGCGRGWLANLASAYGDCTGIEPVAAVVAHGRTLYPHVRLHAGHAETLLQQADFLPFDVVLSSEVIEHVPQPDQAQFVAMIRRLVKPRGHVIVTTPRAEVFDLWKKLAPPNQPVEDWLTEADLTRLFIDNQFVRLGNDRVSIELPSFRFLPAPTSAECHQRTLIPFYQVWAWQAPDEQGQAVSSIPFDVRPLVSVIIPTYNRPDRLRDAIQSVFAQTCQDFEIVVVNDGGQDVTSVIDSFNAGAQLVAIQHTDNRDRAAARNTALRAAKGTYIAYLDDDDRYYPDHLETLLAVLQRGEHKIAYTDAWRIHEKRQGEHYVVTGRDLPHSHDFDPRELLIGNYLPVLTVMHERSCLDQAGYFDESLFVHEDWDLWIRMALHYPFHHIKKATAEFTWRIDGSSTSSSMSDTFRRTMDLIYRKYSPYAERLPGVLEAQKKNLLTLKVSTTTQAPAARTYDCSIIIPVWNNASLTRQCLQALADVTDGVSYEVVVVDNGSTDGVETFLQNLGGDVQVIRNEQNLGFSKACNQGARAARGEYLVFLNNDTVPLKGWLSALVEEIRAHADVAVVGSKLLFEDGTIQHAGVAFSREWFLPYHLYRGGNAQAACVSRRRELQCVTAACMLVRRTVFEQAEGFDEGYRNGFEDVDLCLKIRKLQWKVVYQPKSVLYHLESKTPGRKTYEQDNSRRLQERWGSCWWLADEDLLHFEDGYAVHTQITDGVVSYRLEVMSDPQTIAQRTMLADIQRAALRQDSDAVAGYLRRVQAWPSDPWILRWASLLCAGVGQRTLAIPFWERILTIEEDPYARIGLAKQALETGAFDAADRHLAALLEHEPSHGEGWLLRGIVAMQRLAYAEAEQAFERAKQPGANQRKAMLGLVMAALGGNRLETAWSEITVLCAQEPDDEECMHWLLKCGTMLHRWDALASRLSSFVARNPGNIAMRFALSGVLLRAGRRADAQREYEWLLALAPNFEGMAELAKQLAQAERPLVPNHAA
ncbi:MAG: glycosyltransferase [Nitrospira sp.]|nr:glycosyltransferase [Nitrospira sp.]